MDKQSRASDIAAQIKEKIDCSPKIGAVLGSGWGGVSAHLHETTEIAYTELKGMPTCGVAGHSGKFVFGSLGEKHVVFMQGRIHLYEGKGIDNVVLPIEVMKCLGVETLLLTNSAEGINETYHPRDVMILKDHINLTGANPLIGAYSQADPVFIDMGSAYDKALCRLLLRAAEKAGVNAHAGVYAQMLGPSYETSAEVRMLRSIGADAVGMSTAIETIYARFRKMRVAAISCISNMAAGIEAVKLEHADVLATLQQQCDGLSSLLFDFIGML